MKFSPHSPSRPTATYETIKEKYLQTLQKDPKNKLVVQALKTMTPITFTAPVRRLAADDPEPDPDKPRDTSQLTMIQRGYDIDYEAAKRIHDQDKRDYENGMSAAYAILLDSWCVRAMQQRIQTHPDYATKLIDDPIETLKAIQTLSHDPVRAQYPMQSMLDALRRWVNHKQQDNQGLQDYYNEYKQHRDVVIGHLGKRFLDEFVEHTEEYRKIPSDAVFDAEREELKKNAFDALQALMIIDGADKNKYGSVQRDLVSAYSKQNDQCPRKPETSLDILSNHKFDSKIFEMKKKAKEARARNQTETEGDSAIATSFAQSKANVTCNCCGGYAPDCSKRSSIPKSEWFITKMYNHWQETMESDNTNNNTTTNEATNNGSDPASNDRRSAPQRSQSFHTTTQGTSLWQAQQRQAFQGFSTLKYKDELPTIEEEPEEEYDDDAHNYNASNDYMSPYEEAILLDTGTTINLASNKKLLINIGPSKNPVHMITNGGSKDLTLEGEAPGYKPKFYYDPNGHATTVELQHFRSKLYKTDTSNSKIMPLNGCYFIVAC
jgi:hypothetical protein